MHNNHVNSRFEAKPSRNNVKVLGISGCSCSGKTTLALVIKILLPDAIIIHQDEFYKVDSLIPKDLKTGFDNWDTPEAIDMDKFYERIIEAIHTTSIVKDNIPQDESIREAAEWVRNNMSSKVSGFLKDTTFRYVIVEGFLYFHDSKFLSLLNGAVLTWAKYSTLLDRRKARLGYETKEGFWSDPPKYFERVVWPSFLTYYRCFTSASKDSTDIELINPSSLIPCPANEITIPGLDWSKNYKVVYTDYSDSLGQSSLEIISHLASIS